MPFRFTLAVLGCLLAGSAQARLGALPPEAPRHVAARDLAAIERAGELRVLVNQSRHSSGEWNGQALGIEYRRLQAFARYLHHQPGGRPLRLVFVPKAKEDLLPALQVVRALHQFAVARGQQFGGGAEVGDGHVRLVAHGADDEGRMRPRLPR